MADYELPMKDGKVDMDKVLDSIGMCFEVDTPEIIIQAIDANARAEERKRVASFVENHGKGGNRPNAGVNVIMGRLSSAIRNMGDKP